MGKDNCSHAGCATDSLTFKFEILFTLGLALSEKEHLRYPVLPPERYFVIVCTSGGRMLELKSVRLEFPADANIIVGQSHFIKTVEDLYEAVSTTVPQAKFGLAFNEASGACLTRSEGNDRALEELAIRNAQAMGCGHTFVLLLQNAYPINVLNTIRSVPEVCGIFCATANPVEIIVAQSEQGRGVMGVIDGSSPQGVEGEADVTWRHDLLRKIGYKR
jgi:adenosine/AMP kinase